ncbi:MtrAB system histidine kinase MtrB [Cellulomonas fimi]|uniref:Sensor histidine kinase MtrB n=1 Tax=Cellulomonas fimi TaxID=1708 RepID=A0A7Y0LZ17_CELFI|nr:MtrAB system histidine kinase MtrB [Cellulomonas fimi]NMR20801.1 HAMP domain-containing histidine kinase [Cellulomonas fimi]
MNRFWRRTRIRVLRLSRAVVRGWRSSLQVRVITSTLVIGVVTVVVLGSLLSDRIRDGLFEQRLEEILDESARSTRQAQDTFDAAPANTQLQQLFVDLVEGLQVGGTGQRDVAIQRPLRLDASVTPVFVTLPASDERLVPLISPELRRSVGEGEGQRWQSVAIPAGNPSGSWHDPGVMVGSTVTVPGAATYELYYLYSLGSEQETLDLLQRTLASGAFAVVAVLGIMTWLVTRETVTPVRSAARVAERLADGHLTERMTVRGEDEMATLARSFNEMAESLQVQIRRLEELSALQRRFVSDVSHELRTPLTTIRMAGEVLHGARDDFDPAARRSAELLMMQLDRFEDLLADLLEISRFDAGAATLDAVQQDLREVVTGAVDQALPLAGRKGTWLHVALPEARATVEIDPRRVERILRNLLVNAIEHAEGSDVQVTVAADRQAVAVTVRDHGVGMDQDEAAHVFDRFWRADPARARTMGGTGLGLAISLEDARLHGGWLEAWGRPRQGACFRLTLPRRAGIQLTSSPLPLVPPPDEPPVPEVLAVYRSTPDPASLPDLDQLEHR